MIEEEMDGVRTDLRDSIARGLKAHAAVVRSKGGAFAEVSALELEYAASRVLAREWG